MIYPKGFNRINAMQQTDKTAGTRAVRNAIAIAMAILGFLGAADGWAAEAPTGPAYTNSLGMRFVRFEPVTFTMGVGTDLRIVDRSLENWKYLYDNQPAHAVTLTAPFYVVTDRISKAQFDQAGLGAAPADGRVSWDRATAFCAWLSSREGLAYRLPTEAEWEYVCRNTGTVKNVQTEWVGDWHGAYRNVSLTNPVGPATGVLKVIRHNEYKRGSQVSSVESSAWFRVVLDTAPATRFVASPLPFNQMAVKQSTAPALQGPDPAKPYFAVRFALPIPPDNDRQFNGSLLGVDPAVVDHNHSPGFEIMPNGDALAIWFSGANGSEYGSLTRIVQARLRYGAEEFDMPELLFHTKDQNISPCQWREGTTNWLFTGWGKGQGMGKPGDPPRFRVSRSTDSGATWTMTVPSPKFSSTYGFPQPINSAFRGPNGAMYVAADGTADLVADKFGDSLLWQSMDNGLTWTDQGGRTIGYHSTIVPLDQTGRLLSIGGRPTDINGYMPQNISTDWGATWRAATQSPFPRVGGNQRPSMCRLASGKLVMVGDIVRNDILTSPADWPRGKAPYVALSADNGKTWHFKSIPVALNHEKPQPYKTLGYATVRQAPNGLIHVLATMTHPCLHYEFNEAWVYSKDGDIAPKSGGGRIQTYSENYPGGRPKATWSARICPNGRYLLDGVETHYYENGRKQWAVTWASGRRKGEETLWASNGEKFWSWNHDLTNNVSTWTHWWSNGQKRLESQWDTNPTARDLPTRHFRGLVANGTARHWDPTGREVAIYTFVNGDEPDFPESDLLRFTKIHAPPAIVQIQPAGNASDLLRLPPDSYNRQQENAFGGDADLQAGFRLAWKKEGLELQGEVTDDVFHQTERNEKTWMGDSVQFAVQVLGRKDLDERRAAELALALTPDGPQVWCHSAQSSRLSVGAVGGTPLAVQRNGVQTSYRFFLTAAQLGLAELRPDMVLGFAMLVNDNDGKGRKGFLQWGAGMATGMEPLKYNWLVLAAGTPPAPDTKSREDNPFQQAAEYQVPEVGMEFVWVSALGLYVGKYEVTNGEYRKMKPDHDNKDFKGKSLNGDRQPVVYVNFDEAKAYAVWMTEREQKAGRLKAGWQYRLPTESEWQAFAQCGDGREYPWGNGMPPKYGNYHGTEGAGVWNKIQDKKMDGSPVYTDGFPVTCPVETSGKNDWGLYGVGGNVWECASDYAGHFGAWRGGSWYSSNPRGLRADYRILFSGSSRDDLSGFRLVLGAR